MGGAVSTQAAAWPGPLDVGLTRQQHEWLFRAWGLCCDNTSGALTAAQLVDFLAVLESPQGFGDCLPGQELLGSLEARVLDLHIRGSAASARAPRRTASLVRAGLPRDQSDAVDVSKSTILFHDVGTAIAHKLKPEGAAPFALSAAAFADDFTARLEAFYATAPLPVATPRQVTPRGDVRTTDAPTTKRRTPPEPGGWPTATTVV